MQKFFVSILLAGTALSSAAFAAPAQKATPDPRLTLLEQQLRDVQQQLAAIKASQGDTDYSGAVVDLKRSTSDQYVDINNRLDAQNKASVDNGRLSVSSADGRFTAAIRGLLQYDTGYYSQSHAATTLPAAFGPDLGSGSNFRRVYLGLSGKVFNDWSYNLNFDFGGSGGTETPGHIQSVYLQYDGLGPWAFRIGAYPPPTSVEDATSAGDTIFLERNAPSDLQRNIAGGDGRDSISIIYAGPTLFGAVSYTGDKVSDGTKALAAGTAVASNFDEQQAVVGRLSWLPIAEADAHWLIGVNGTYVIKPADLIANGTVANSTNTPGGAVPSTISLSDPPELTFDNNGTTLATTGALGASHLSQWGVETAGNWGSVYGQAGYYGFNVQRLPTALAVTSTVGAATTTTTSVVQPSNNNFSAWYVQGSWLLTGEERNYNPSTGSFTSPKVAENFNINKGGWGAFELAARYSDMNLNDNAGDTTNLATTTTTASTTKTYNYYNTVRGGDQRIATLGLNWYPNSVVKFAFNYEYIQNSRLQSPATVTTAGTPALPAVNGGQNLSAVAFRAQLAL